MRKEEKTNKEAYNENKEYDKKGDERKKCE